jgi:hypothetical protein
MTLAKAWANETFVVEMLLMIVTYNRQNIFIVLATVVQVQKLSWGPLSHSW